jgi:multicomponent Na+:H+ antiporter subunit B
MIDIIHAVLFTFLAVIAIAIIRLRDLFAAVMLMGIFSLLSASLFTVMDAVDVAFTEAAVGAGISTILMLATLSLTHSRESMKFARPRPLALVAVVLTGAALIYATFDMPSPDLCDLRHAELRRPGRADPPPCGGRLHRAHRS